MAEKDIGALVVTLEAQTAAFEKGMQSATKELQRFGNASKTIEGQFGGLQGAFFKFNQATQAISTGLNLISGAFSKLTGFAKVRENLENVKASFDAVLGGADRAADMIERVMKISNELGTSLPVTADAVRRMAIGLKQLGSSNEEIERVSKTFLKIGALGGSIEEAAAAIFQFSQALGSGTLRGDELISLLERQPLIAQEISKYMSEVRGMGDGTIGSLRRLASEGKVTSEILRDALLNAEERIAEAYAKIPIKIGQALNRIKNRLDQFYIEVSREFKINEGISKVLEGALSAIEVPLGNLTQALKDLKKNFDDVIWIATGLAAVFAGPLLSSIVAATVAMRAFGVAAIAFAKSPLGLLISGAVLLLGFYKEIRDTFLALAEGFVEIGAIIQEAFGGDSSNLRSKLIEIQATRMEMTELGKATQNVTQQTEKLTDAQRKAAEAAKKFKEDSEKAYGSFLESLDKAKVEAALFDKKIQELQKRISSETDPKVLKALNEQFEQLKASAGEFEAWLIGISKVSFGDTLSDLYQQLIELERLMNNAEDPVLFKKYEEGFKRTKAAIEDATDPLAELKRTIEETAKAAELIPEKLAVIDEALANGKLNPEQAQKLRDQVQGLNDDFRKLSESITDSIAGNASNAVNTFIDSIGRAKFSMADFAESVIKDIAKIIFQLLIMKPLVDSIKASLSGIGAGGKGPTLLNVFADGGSFENGTGLSQGVYNSPQLFKFADGGVFGSRMGVMGEAGPEAIMPLKRNAQGKLGVEAASTNITIVNNAGADVQATETTNSDGSKQIDIFIERKVKEMFGGGTMDKSMKSSYGLTRVGV
jgi:tape measure domain-containing protein